MQKTNRADKILIALAMLILLISSGALYFDDWMWGGRNKSGEQIGFVSARRGDVRFRYEGDLKWQKATRGQGVMYNDAVYAGPESTAEIVIGEGQVSVTENSMVVIRREDVTNFLKIRFGSVFGQFAANEKVVIDTGDGKPIEFTAKTKTKILVKKSGNKTELELVSGAGSIKQDGKTTQLDKPSRVSVAEVKPPKVEELNLEIVSPKRGEEFFSTDPYLIGFEWRWSDGHRPKPDEKFEIEFSKEANFSKIFARKNVIGKADLKLRAEKSTRLYFRVKGPQGQLSQIEAVSYTRMIPPKILKPELNSLWAAESSKRALVDFEFEVDPLSESLWWQVARDSKFKKNVVNQNQKFSSGQSELTPGTYFLRAKNSYGPERLSAWSSTQRFVVKEKIQVNQMPVLAQRATIPNRDYPSYLYKASKDQIQSFLMRQGFLEYHFSDLQKNFDIITLNFSSPSQQVIRTDKVSWPKEYISPKKYRYRYQLEKEGFLPSQLSEENVLAIQMAPPKAIGDAEYGEVEAGFGEVSLKWTPILFADHYEFEVSNDPGFVQARNVKSKAPFLVTKVPTRETTFLRARALDASGIPISEFSNPEVVMHDTSVPAFLAENDRDPSSEQSVMKPEDLVDDRWSRSGFWFWYGGGYNFTDYRQSIPGRGTVDFRNVVGGSQYLEAGFSRRGLGGLFTFKETPGKIVIGNASVDRDRYTWSHYSIEAQARKNSAIMFLNRPVILGFRLGLQHHQMPFLFLNAAQALEQKTMRVDSASAGGLIQWSRAKWNYYWLMRYQYPISSQADGASQFTLRPIFAFDGSVGAAYDITQRLKAGAFWYGQWHQFDFNFSDGAFSNEGFQSLFYSTIDFRLGFQF